MNNYTWRLYFLAAILIIALSGLIFRILDLGIFQQRFLEKQGSARSVREIDIPAHRGMIIDRNGEPLAVSVGVDSVWVNPKEFTISRSQLKQLAELLDLAPNLVLKKIMQQRDHGFLYLKRHIPPDVADKIKQLNISGISFQHEYQRYYPESESAVHVIGFTNVDDKGQEGLELGFDSWLRGISGKRRVIKDRLGNIIADLGITSEPQPGRDLVLSLDRRIQFLAYNELVNTVEKFHAESGTAVVLAVKTGEVLAMANYPSCNPNNRENMHPSCYKNAAVTDLFEPGSTMKSFSIASALMSGKYFPTTLINTNPGRFTVDNHVIRDDENKNNGVLTVSQVLQKSSDIGVAKITLSLPPNNLLKLIRDVGFGQSLLTGFPGEASGVLPDHLEQRPLVLATLAFGYAISLSPLQLAHAYAIIADRGLEKPVTFLKVAPQNQSKISTKAVIPAKIAEELLTMLRTVVELGGTGTKAQVHGFNIAGKTGTAHISEGRKGYAKDRYWSSFAGIAPATDPQLVVVVVIKNPRGLYHGGSVAAPAFANIMDGALRLLDVKPDAILQN